MTIEINDRVFYLGQFWYVYEKLTQEHRYMDGEQVQVTLSNYPKGTGYTPAIAEQFIRNVPVEILTLNSKEV